MTNFRSSELCGFDRKRFTASFRVPDQYRGTRLFSRPDLLLVHPVVVEPVAWAVLGWLERGLP